MGIESLGNFMRLDIAGNNVRRNIVLPATPGTSSWFAVRIGSLAAGSFVAVSANLAFIAVGTSVYTFIGTQLTTAPREKEIAGVEANLLEGYGGSPTVSVIANGAFTFSTNRCLLTAVATQGNIAQSVAQMRAAAIIASANYLEGPPKLPALVLQLAPEKGPFTVLGNISSGAILVNGSVLAVPWAPLNVIAS